MAGNYYVKKSVVHSSQALDTENEVKIVDGVDYVSLGTKASNQLKLANAGSGNEYKYIGIIDTIDTFSPYSNINSKLPDSPVGANVDKPFVHSQSVTQTIGTKQVIQSNYILDDGTVRSAATEFGNTANTIWGWRSSGIPILRATSSNSMSLFTTLNGIQIYQNSSTSGFEFV